MLPLVAYVLLFIVVASGFILVHLLVGKLIRPNRPSAEKQTIYECGEPTIGSAWIQFDLRFYVVALLFVVFDVEVAFFFPWAEVFGKANNLVAMPKPETEAEWEGFAQRKSELIPPHLQKKPEVDRDTQWEETRTDARQLALLAFGEIVVFFGVLLVGFAYLWRRGDLEWVRSTAAERSVPVSESRPASRPLPLVSAGSAQEI
jgi:NADH-quinone oxidoreductase subunit A